MVWPILFFIITFVSCGLTTMPIFLIFMCSLGVSLGGLCFGYCLGDLFLPKRKVLVHEEKYPQELQWDKFVYSLVGHVMEEETPCSKTFKIIEGHADRIELHFGEYNQMSLEVFKFETDYFWLGTLSPQRK